MEKKILICAECLALGGSCLDYGCYCVRHVESCAELNGDLRTDARMSLKEIYAFIDRCEEAGCEFGEIARRRVEELKDFFDIETFELK